MIEEDKKCIIICAPSGAGKTSITKYLLKQIPLLEFSISATTREKRISEVDKKDYYFLSKSDFKKKIENNDFIEWEEVFKDNFYGTFKSEVKRIWSNNHYVIFDVDVEGGLSLTEYFNEKALTLFIKPPSFSELEKRLKGRGSDTPEEVKKRLIKAKKELDYEQWFDTTVINKNLKKAQEEALTIVKSFLNI